MASGGVVASLLSSATKLLDLLRGAPSVSRRAGQQQPVSADVHRLQRLLRRIQATIDDAGEREIRDSSVKLWIAEITVVARDAEDVLEDYRYELIRRRVQRLEGTGGGASTSCKRKHHHDDQGYGIREVTQFLVVLSLALMSPTATNRPSNKIP
jgi:hypothetical protein